MSTPLTDIPRIPSSWWKGTPGWPRDPCTLISETKCLYLSLGLQPNNSPRATVPTMEQFAWVVQKRNPKRDQSYSYISKHHGGSEDISICRANGQLPLKWKELPAPIPERSPRPPPHSAGCTSSISRHLLQPLYTSGRGIYYSSPSLWNDGLWSHLSSFNTRRCASIFWWSLWRRSFTQDEELATFRH